jgi:hypothetical protein
MSRDSALATAADAVERWGAGLGLVLRESRLDVWEETDSLQVEEMSMVFDPTIAEQLASTLVRARLTIPDEPVTLETVIDSYDEVLAALRSR